MCLRKSAGPLTSVLLVTHGKGSTAPGKVALPGSFLRYSAKEERKLSSVLEYVSLSLEREGCVVVVVFFFLWGLKVRRSDRTMCGH
jgi:hypothetical protein